MNIIINCKQMDLTRNLKEYAEEKIGKFRKYLSNITEATVTLSVEKYRHKAEVLLKVNGSFIQAESITGEMYSSIDEVAEKLARQVRKYKEKTISHRKNKNRQEALPPAEESFPVIIKNKSYNIKPMSVDEAAMQMDLLDNNFFVFTNASSGNINVLYKRSDGNFGLIEPIK
ncbi:MAG TPA: ribosome-associated translation inhibitor RaiA [Nitrospirae bacterium]|nr:ribosome-associated factor Y [bacterium BMS3Abin06]HDH12191.1 ribosome-associated translation inhibitor RaiA [Nitrospirota bacterium]HDZ03131.1 ribosome-associated translation inhibitor RaiA [Nitrospirota bacterium]